MNHLSEQEIERYRQRKMSPAELIAASDHVATCEVCSERFSDSQQLEIAYTRARTDLQEMAGADLDHIVYEHLAAYVDNKLNEEDREFLENHLMGCPQCDAVVRDLRSLSTRMAAYADKEYTPATPEVPSAKPVPFWGLSTYRVPLQIGAVIILAALSFLTGIFLGRRDIGQLRSQSDQLKQANEELQRQASEAERLQTQLAELKRENEQLRQSSFNKEVVVALSDKSGRITLDNQGNLEGLKSLPPTYQEAIKTALTTGRVKTAPITAQLTGEQGVLMGGAGDKDSFSLLSPFGTVVQTDRPTLRWHALDGATAYTVTVGDSDLNRVAISQPLSSTEWTVPHPLKRGGIYSWQVKAYKEGREVVSPPPPHAKFKVLEQGQADELERVRRIYNRSHLVLGILYAQFGLLDDAEREFQALLKANPKSSVAQELLRSLRPKGNN